MKETLKAFLVLEKAGLISNIEKATRLLGIYDLTSTNHQDALWEMAEGRLELAGASMVGSEPISGIVTEEPPGGAAPGVKPVVEPAYRS